ncbi:two-component sensor histidine kinase [Streptomyces sp. Vc74B-19]|uniref:sensor histidine kinase n=1 Tax=unclassified Streptomyces TaxID=2593676 RepID=UPI001BFC5643|nr:MULTISPECIES: sensor histidine kinase [unclassified Streptomyces]MBT3163527.1 two-component sensor histidine kinase [Streptomyces sp. Vc74B-19]
MTRLRGLREVWGRLHVTVRDLPFAVLLFATAFVPDFHGSGTEIGSTVDRPFDAVAVVAIGVQCLPLALRRRWPLICVALVAGGFALDQLRGYHSVAASALPLALLSTGAHLERYRRTAVAGLSLAYVALVAEFVRRGTEEPAAEFVSFYVALCLLWGGGVWLRSTRLAEAERRHQVAEQTRAAERARIARELHDVVTHHVTAMVVQAEAARYLTAAPDRLDETLTAVTDTGRRAVADLRHLLDLLNPDHGVGSRTPPVGRLLTLVEQTRRAGQPVEFTEKGTPAASTGSADLVAYRVVQEALTNALKYAHGRRTSVLVQHSGRDITVEVGTDGPGRAAGASPGGSGRGLAGLRERVDVLGGEFDAGPRPGGGFAVRARIPNGSGS